MPNTKVLLTGANGRTGRPVVSALNERGAKVCAFIRDSQQATALKAIGATECAIGDMEDQSSIEAAMSGCTHLHRLKRGHGAPLVPRTAMSLDRHKRDSQEIEALGAWRRHREQAHRYRIYRPNPNSGHWNVFASARRHEI